MFVFLITFLSIFAVSPAFASDAFYGEVVGITDGDTIKVLHDGAVTKVRLANIDCPEHNQSFGQRAKEFTAEYVFGKIVTIDNEGTDRYGRTIGEVIPNDEPADLNHALVANGLAWVYQKYCHDTSFYQSESIAQAQHIGLWADPNAQPPWEFRRQEKQAKANSKP
jgi:endonuclease YncB( thermonuclease family)